LEAVATVALVLEAEARAEQACIAHPSTDDDSGLAADAALVLLFNDGHATLVIDADVLPAIRTKTDTLLTNDLDAPPAETDRRILAGAAWH